MTENSSGADNIDQVDQPIKLVHRTDSIVALIILTGAFALYYATTQFEEVSVMLSQNIGPELFPQILLIVIFVLTLTLPIEYLFLEGGAPRLDKDRKAPVAGITWKTIGLMIAIGLLMPFLGTLLTIVSICISLPLLWGERRLRVIAPFAIFFPAAVTLVFSKFLKVHFLPGLLEYIL
jgi:putative tricarboxylic transport membrane protein